MVKNNIKEMDKEEQQCLKLNGKEYAVGDLAVGTIQKVWLWKAKL